MTELRATYRLQLGGGFGFEQARELVPYLRDLGVSHLYLPPSFQAREGSTHGYDVVDPTSISEELGGERAFEALARAVREAGMGLILDIVPNHMATDDANRYWSDPDRRRRFFDLDEETGRHRRFFDIDHLAAVRQEDEAVFDETHKLALALVREGTVDGLRIDHPDGLADPAGYLRRLREGGARHVWVEKILDPGEHLRDWAVEGTVGYEFLNDVAALFVDPAGEAPLTALWEEVSGDPRPFHAYADEAKLEQARTTFAPEVDRLRREAPREVGGLERALASLPVYRTYVEPWSGLVTGEDREAIEEAGLPESLARVLRLEERGWDAFVTRFQQTTPPVMAKGVEDTAFYRYLRLLALNDVGGDPGRFGISIEQFHAANAERAERFPNNLLVTQTHDTKRSGDVRARIGALSAMADAWAQRVRRWLELTRDLVGPDDVERYLIFQTLAGAWPIELERLQALPREGAARGQAHDQLDRARRGARGRGAGVRRRALRARRVPGRLRAVRRRARAARATARRSPSCCSSSPSPGCRTSTRATSCSRSRSWTPTTAGRSTGRSAGARSTSCAAAPRRRTSTRKLWLIMRALVLRRTRAAAFAGAYEPLDAGPRTVAFLRGGDVLAAAAVRGEGDPVALPPGPLARRARRRRARRRRRAWRCATASRCSSAHDPPARRCSTASCSRRGARCWSRSTTASTATARRSASSRCSRSSRSRCCWWPRSGSSSTTPRSASGSSRPCSRTSRCRPRTTATGSRRRSATRSSAPAASAPFSVLLLIVAGTGVMGALRHTINEAWDIHDRPPLLRRKALDLALILGATIVLALSLAVTATRKAANVLDDEEGGGPIAALLDFVGDVLPFVFTGAVILFLYCVLPMQRQRVKDVWPGVVVAVLLLAILREGLEVYFEHLADFGALYGSLGALMALLLFVYAAAMVLLFGAEFASEWTRLPDEESEVSAEVSKLTSRLRRSG